MALRRASLENSPLTPEQARMDERHAIGRQLHAGILQELTVAGFRLQALRSNLPPSAKLEVTEFASWLAARQAELRAFVAQLEEGSGTSAEQAETDFEGIVAAVAAGLDCSLTCAVLPAGAKPPPAVRGPLADVVAALLPLAVKQLGGHALTVVLDLRTRPLLRISHDGRPARQDTDTLGQLRKIIGANGASLRLVSRKDSEQIVADWAD